MTKQTCTWPGNDPLLIKYHDEEWGVPVHDDHKHFEFLVLDAFQAGLSWKTVLYRREHFRRAFAGFDYEKVARFGEKEVTALLQDATIIRNKMKINAAVRNARQLMEVREKWGSFDTYIWQFSEGGTINGKRKQSSDIPATSPESDAMSEALRKLGFSFVGSTICYAFMQATGMVNDHLVSCPCHKRNL